MALLRKAVFLWSPVDSTYSTRSLQGDSFDLFFVQCCTLMRQAARTRGE